MREKDMLDSKLDTSETSKLSFSYSLSDSQCRTVNKQSTKTHLRIIWRDPFFFSIASKAPFRPPLCYNCILSTRPISGRCTPPKVCCSFVERSLWSVIWFLQEAQRRPSRLVQFLIDDHLSALPIPIRAAAGWFNTNILNGSSYWDQSYSYSKTF